MSKRWARARHALIAILAAAFAGAAAFLLTFSFHGAFRFFWPVHSPVNAESIVAVSFLLLSFLCVRERGISAENSVGSGVVLITAIALGTALAFLPTIAVPLLHDSYTHVYEALHESWAEVLKTFTPRGGAFLRPLGYISYYFDGKWAGTSPFRWHLGNVVLHVANTCLVYWLVRRLTGKQWAAGIAALLFGIHGARPEAVSWVAARYDLLAGFFVLTALLAVDAYAETKRARWYLPIVLCTICAVLSKESAYSLPFLAALLAPFKAEASRRRTLYAAAATAATAAIAMVYRLWILGDVGGYRAAPGHAEVLQFNPVHSANALFLREWAFLLFPMNWSKGAGLGISVAVLLMFAVAVGLLVWSQTKRVWLVTAVLWVIAGALPVQHLLLLRADLAGARVLYLPVLGVALLFGLLVSGVPDVSRRWSLTGALILFQLIALLHNEAIWREVANLSQQACRGAGSEVAKDPARTFFRDLPVTRHGVFFLANGFPYCVEMNSGVKAEGVRVIERDAAPPAGSRVLDWNDDAARFVESGASK